VKVKRKTKNEKRLAAAVVAFVTFSLFAFRFSFAQSTQPAGQIQKSFDELADADGQVRDAARVALMGLSRDDLQALREVVEKSRPLAAAQAVALHDIVTHVYLAGENNRSVSNSGFLGVRLAPIRENGMIVAADDQTVDTGEVSGVLIRECMPGFSGFRYLREGDVVLGIKQPIQMRTPQQQDLINAVSAVPPQGTIRLEVLRQGRVTEISFRISARPREADDQVLTEELLNRRRAQAEQFWREHFSRLVSENVS